MCKMKRKEAIIKHKSGYQNWQLKIDKKHKGQTGFFKEMRQMNKIEELLKDPALVEVRGVVFESDVEYKLTNHKHEYIYAWFMMHRAHSLVLEFKDHKIKIEK